MKEYLTDIEITKVEQFCSDQAMYDAVHKVITAALYYTGALRKGEKFEVRNQAFDLIARASREGKPVSNEALGEEFRGLFAGVDLVEQAFAQLKTIKGEDKSIPTPYNPGI